MKKALLLVLLLACGGEALDEISEVSETTSSTQISTTTSTSTSTTTTTTLPETTTSTVNIEDVVLPVVSFSNCPEKQISGDEFELGVKVEAGNYDLNYLRISQWKNEEYDGRIYYEKSNPNNEFPFPVAENNTEFTVILNDDEKNQIVTYEVFISASDESNAFIEVEERCKVIFNNIPATTTSTTTTTTTTTTTLNTVNETYTGSGDNLVLIPQYSQLVVAEIVGNQSDKVFVVRPLLGDKSLSSLVITSDPYSGITPLNFDNENPDAIEVSAVGEWSIVIKSVLTTPIFSGDSISGIGDSVIQFPENKNTYQDLTIVGNQSDKIFVVRPYSCDGSAKSSLVITSDPYNGTVRSRSGACYLVISAVGEWTISR